MLSIAGALQVWVFSWDQKVPLSSHAAIAGSPTVFSTASASGLYVVSGAASGSVRVEQHGQNQCWEATLHDGHTGGVSCATLSYDDTHLLSAARDGTLLVMELGRCCTSRHLPLPPGTNSGVLPSLASYNVPEVPDIIGVDAPTLEEAAAVAAQGAAVSDANAVKDAMRNEVAALRGELAALLAVNAGLSPCQQLPHDAFTVDPGELGRSRAEGPESGRPNTFSTMCCARAACQPRVHGLPPTETNPPTRRIKQAWRIWPLPSNSLLASGSSSGRPGPSLWLLPRCPSCNVSSVQLLVADCRRGCTMSIGQQSQQGG